MKYYLGVDGGASKTSAVLIDQNRKILGRGQSAGSNANVYGQKEAVNQVYLAIKQALGGKSASVIGCLAIAGINENEGKKAWERATASDLRFSFFVKPPLLVNDVVAALRSGTTDPNSVALIAGTGSNCWGRNDKNQEAKSGGGDYILGDQGSGYDIGLKILKNVIKAHDGRGEKTLLTDLLFGQLKIKSVESLKAIVYEKPWNKADIAKIAALVEVAAQKQDKIANRIIEEVVTDLYDMIKAVATRLDLKNKPFTIVTTGSVFKVKKIREDLEGKIKKFAPYAKFVEPTVDSATAAAYLAKEAV